MKELFEKLFIFEMANNHMGDVNHGLKIIRETHDIAKNFDFRFGFKFQYRNLNTFIHPDFKDRDDIKYVKRFSETSLEEAEFIILKKEAEKLGFITICTPFDEQSVDLVERHDFDIIKIASCSFTDWPLIEKIAKTDKPIIISTAGALIENIDNVIAFFKHRNKNLCLMHCVGEYPTLDENLELNQIDFFINRYEGITVGFSTHEDPENFVPITLAIAKGAKVCERHVGIETEKYKLNAYSSSPEQINAWLAAAKKAFNICGGSKLHRRKIAAKEEADLKGLKRGIFAKTLIARGEEITQENTFYAIPNIENQLLANDVSKYKKFVALKDINSNAAVLFDYVEVTDKRSKVYEITQQLISLLKKSGIRLQNQLDLELSHHYGIEKFYRWGCSMINCINREYCKKLILVLPGQENPTHYHKLKEETFHVLYGDIHLVINGTEKLFKAGDLFVVERNAKHSFSSKGGAVFEEVSTTHYKNDSFYDDQNIMDNKERKTALTFWADWLE